MSLLKIWGVLKAILPTKRIGAWILGILGALVALIMGVSNTDLKAAFCESKEVVELPKIEIQPPAPVPAPVPAPEPAKK